MYLLNYLLTYFIRATAQAILNKFAGSKYHKCKSSSILFAILLGIKRHFTHVGIRCCKVRLNNFITQRLEDSL